VETFRQSDTSGFQTLLAQRNSKFQNESKTGDTRAVRAASVLIVAVGLLGCGDDSLDDGDLSGDSCTPGDNMTDPRLDNVPDASAADPEVLIAWDVGTGRGADLPSAYFDAVELALDTEDSVEALVTAVEHSAEREIVVRFSDLSTFVGSETPLRFTLEFPDRAEHIDCTHPGMNDRYLLQVMVQFDASGQLAFAELEQVVELGDI
jgi:hypothetical protein